MRTPRATRARDEREEGISRTIVETVAEAEGVAPTELDACLYDIIDPDALNVLFRSGKDDSTTEGVVSFTFNGYEVAVHADSTVEIDSLVG